MAGGPPPVRYYNKRPYGHCSARAPSPPEAATARVLAFVLTRDLGLSRRLSVHTRPQRVMEPRYTHTPLRVIGLGATLSRSPLPSLRRHLPGRRDQRWSPSHGASLQPRETECHLVPYRDNSFVLATVCLAARAVTATTRADRVSCDR